MAEIAWFGTGLMGSAFAEALRKHGREVAVWNRTYERALPLERFGARAVRDPREAVRGASRIHISLSDDAAVDALLARLNGAIEAHAVVIDHSTVAPATTAARFARMRELGHTFLHAPCFMSPTAARAGEGVMLVSGSSDAFETVRSALAGMARQVYYVGADGRKAAALKLVGNAMGTSLVGGLADVFALGRSLGIAPDEALDLLANLKLEDLIERLGGKMISGDLRPNVELRTARKDVGLMLDAAEGCALQVIPAIATRMDALIAAGHGGDDVVVLGADQPSKR